MTEKATRNIANSRPTLKDTLDLLAREIGLSTNCHALATVQSFDPDQQSVTATINYKKSFIQANLDGTTSTRLEDYAILVDCPVVIMQGGKGALTFPIEEGDTCLILFNDRDMDTWVQSGQIDAPPTSRLHSFSDGIALVGVRPFSKALSSYEEDRIALKTKLGTMISIGRDGGPHTGKVRVANAATNLGFILDTFLTSLSSATDPVVVAAAAAAKIQVALLMEITP